MSIETEISLLELRNAIAEKEWITACANMETCHKDGWSCDWGFEQRRSNIEINRIIETLRGTE